MAKELTKDERQSLKARWESKVKVGKGRGNGHGPCWRWTGAHSKTRNGLRPVIRIGTSNMSAVRVGIALATGAKLESEAIARGNWQHRGKMHGTVACVNAAHYEQRKKQESARASRKK